ncbi:MAG: 3-methyl-2-oxobutanoate hydroxymethyltransferase [Cohaesibacter sp.]|jgi:3-methyl-2-oxobutanoate hydroxymethyltransferase|nr:3-methyl-2-oxobutanoate hydroxymethyltransferase [Cohaesibacter sp.]
MSAQNQQKRISTTDILQRKGKEPIVSLTAYTAPMARLLDPHADILLVGDSVGMVLHGLETTLPVTLDMMILHGQAVMRGSARALVAIDMPFGSYEESPQQAYCNAVEIMQKTGCTAVKLEGGRHMAPTIAFLTSRGVPVMGHIGLTPQAVQVDGGFKVKGKDSDRWAELEADGLAVQEAGAFCVVLEGIVEPLAKQVSSKLSIPTIGIGASSACDGQILVSEDMLGFADRVPKFVKRYAEVGQMIDQAVGAYAKEVRERSFPGPDHVYTAPK